MHRTFRQPEAAAIVNGYSHHGNERERIAQLRGIVDLGAKAENAKYILDIFLDDMENDILKEMLVTRDTRQLQELRLYYKAALRLSTDITRMIDMAVIKADTIHIITETMDKE